MQTALRHTDNGSFAPAGHLEFVRNRRRNQAFKKAFDHFASGKTVLDVGTGSGLLAIYAACAGAREVIAIEKDEKMAEIARRNFERNGLGIIKLMIGDALSLTEIPSVDIVCGELLSTWCVAEPQIPVISHLLKILENKPILVPRKIINLVQGVHATFGDEEGLVRFPTTYFEFDSTEKALDVTPSVVASEILFSAGMSPDATIRITLTAMAKVQINALRLTSIVEIYPGIYFGAANDTMPAMIVPLPKEISVVPGQIISLTISYTYGAGWENFKVNG
ncbi:50S ribosomal protein L11 methyltransferase [Candidatus Micrarchaeota archaeon]|nr:50S ribosomal protein L11 methyltransferase [Candidatus Micrarchaeota archaeon]